MKFLIIEDSKILVKKISHYLKLIGFEVVGEAYDGFEGFEKYKELKPDVVLLDITMPNRDGRECLIEIINYDKKAKVIMLSALKADEVINECKKIGAIDFIHKDNLIQLQNFSDHLRASLGMSKVKVETVKAS